MKTKVSSCVGFVAFMVLGGSMFTESIDQFWEGGGLVTFDREIVKFDYEFLRALHREILDAARDGAAKSAF